jgi:hypothetical protein
VDSSFALSSKFLTVPNVYAFELPKWLIVLTGVARLGAAIYTKSTNESTYSQLYVVRHAWYLVPQSRQGESRGPKC